MKERPTVSSQAGTKKQQDMWMLSRWQIIDKEAQAVETFFLSVIMCSFASHRRNQELGGEEEEDKGEVEDNDDVEKSGVVDYDEFFPHQCAKYAELFYMCLVSTGACSRHKTQLIAIGTLLLRCTWAQIGIWMEALEKAHFLVRH